MKWFNDREQSIKSLTKIYNLLKDCMSSLEFNLTRTAEQTLTALALLDSFLDRNPNVHCSYRDVLKSELFYLSRREVPYINLFENKLLTIPFEAIEKESHQILFKDGTSKSADIIIKEHYRTGNKAIGQIYINDEEAFYIKHAIEHSLKSTIVRWSAQTSRFLSTLERA